MDGNKGGPTPSLTPYSHSHPNPNLVLAAKSAAPYRAESTPSPVSQPPAAKPQALASPPPPTPPAPASSPSYMVGEQIVFAMRNLLEAMSSITTASGNPNEASAVRFAPEHLLAIRGLAQEMDQLAQRNLQEAAAFAAIGNERPQREATATASSRSASQTCASPTTPTTEDLNAAAAIRRMASPQPSAKVAGAGFRGPVAMPPQLPVRSNLLIAPPATTATVTSGPTVPIEAMPVRRSWLTALQAHHHHQQQQQQLQQLSSQQRLQQLLGATGVEAPAPASATTEGNAQPQTQSERLAAAVEADIQDAISRLLVQSGCAEASEAEQLMHSQLRSFLGATPNTVAAAVGEEDPTHSAATPPPVLSELGMSAATAVASDPLQPLVVTRHPSSSSHASIPSTHSSASFPAVEETNASAVNMMMSPPPATAVSRTSTMGSQQQQPRGHSSTSIGGTLSSCMSSPMHTLDLMSRQSSSSFSKSSTSHHPTTATTDHQLLTSPMTAMMAMMSLQHQQQLSVIDSVDAPGGSNAMEGSTTTTAAARYQPAQFSQQMTSPAELLHRMPPEFQALTLSSATTNLINNTNIIINTTPTPADATSGISSFSPARQSPQQPSHFFAPQPSPVRGAVGGAHAGVGYGAGGEFPVPSSSVHTTATHHHRPLTSTATALQQSSSTASDSGATATALMMAAAAASLTSSVTPTPSQYHPDLPSPAGAAASGEPYFGAHPAGGVGAAPTTPPGPLPVAVFKSVPKHLLDCVNRTVTSNPMARYNHTVGWEALRVIWNITMGSFDDAALSVLRSRSSKQQEAILLMMASFELRDIMNLSAFLISLIKEYDKKRHVCIHFLVGLCDDDMNCLSVHPHNTPGWNELRNRWGITYRDLDYAVLSNLARRPYDEREGILQMLCEMSLKSIDNMSAFVSAAIRKFDTGSLKIRKDF